MSTPPFVPTDEQRKLVEMYTAMGATQADISKKIDINETTLREHFRRELDLGIVDANTKVAGKLFKKAMDGNVTAMIFWLKTRARWKETSAHEFTGKDGEPLNPVTIFQVPDNGRSG